MENHTLVQISLDVNYIMFNHFMYGWNSTDRWMLEVESTYTKEEFALFMRLWNKRSARINAGINRLN
jgi:hypothetical protein